MNQLRVYIAAPFEDRSFVEQQTAWLESLGHICLSTWWSHTDRNLHDCSMSPHALSCLARGDIAQLVRADCLIFMAQQRGTGEYFSGGRHVEFGVALAAGLHIICVGKPENIFHYLPGVRWVSVTDDLSAELEEVRKCLQQTDPTT
jgi:hypothetical protein